VEKGFGNRSLIALHCETFPMKKAVGLLLFLFLGALLGVLLSSLVSWLFS